ncbi:MAG TPA: hypothetical protein PKH16_10105 [Aequorivita sp.]|nr:hypothetical protein [Aequorivita sp.]
MNDLDKQAYNIVCHWYQDIDFNPVYKGIDYSLIIRFYLWDKVGRALRIKHRIDYGESEIYKKEYLNFPQYYTPFVAKGNYKKPFFKAEKIVFIPFQSPHIEKLILPLQKVKGIRVLSKQKGKVLSNDDVIKSPSIKNNDTWHQILYKSILVALKKYNISFIEEDKALLRIQLEGVFNMTLLAVRELKKYKPNALYVHSDNHPPFISYVLAAKKLNIPTFTYQHGLDCEHYFLDDNFADYVAVWSENRKERYLRDSQFIAKNYKVVGNVFLPLLEEKETVIRNNSILYVSRPHSPIKCYSPSRNYLEGVMILAEILEFMKQHTGVHLTIKPHPLDLVSVYYEVIKKYGLEDRVTIASEPLNNLFKTTTVVVTEDTTAGAEAMYYNLPCIHAHFANSEPVLPFVAYGCALSGRTPQQLKKNLQLIGANPILSNEAIAKQATFVKDIIPKGNVEDLVNFITNNMV